MNKKISSMLSSTSRATRLTGNLWLRTACVLLFASFFTSCGVYTFRDVSIDYTRFKTVKIGYLENKARYVNPQLSPKLTDAVQQKIASYTKLTRTTNDNADYQISGTVTGYNVSTSAISSQQAATNRLTVSAHITLLNALDNKTQEFDVNRDFDFSASLTLTQAEGQLLNDIVKNMSDEIFNRLFSNW